MLQRVVLFLVFLLVSLIYVGCKKLLKKLRSNKHDQDGAYPELKRGATLELIVDPADCDIKASCEIDELSEKEIQLSCIIYKTDVDGQSMQFVSRPIKGDPVTVRYYLSKQRRVTIYCNRTNPDDYQFDLNFLHEFETT